MAIDKVNGNSYGYQNGGMPRKNAALKAYESESGAGKQKPKTGRAAQSGRADAAPLSGRADSGVILDLTSPNAASPGRERAQTGQTGLFDGIKRAWAAFMQWLKDFWNSDSSPDTPAADAAAPDGSTLAADAAAPDGSTLAADTAAPDGSTPAADAAVLRTPADTLMEALALGHVTLDDLDTAQVSILLEQGIDVMAIGQGEYDFNGYISLRRAQQTGAVSESGASAGTGAVSGRTAAAPADDLPDGGADSGETFSAGYSDLHSPAVGALPPAAEAEAYNPQLAQAIKSGSLKRIEEILTENGAKRLAHNSDLLTYYDRKGRLVEIDDTQKHRVLHGDRNILKL